MRRLCTHLSPRICPRDESFHLSGLSLKSVTEVLWGTVLSLSPDNDLLSTGAAEGEQHRGHPGVPGVLSSGKRSVAQPDGEGTPGDICSRKGDEKKRC